MTTLVTWNCNMAFRKKKDRLLECNPDVLVVQECECPDQHGDWSAFSDWCWIGANEHKGLAVFTRNGLSLETAGTVGDGGRFTLPVETDGPLDVLGVWAMNDEENPKHRYISQVYEALRDYEDFVGGNTVVAGDFNWNVIWDESPKYSLVGDFSDTVALLHDAGLRSAYHASTDHDFGREDDSTFFMHKKRDRCYHTDYVFVPETDGEGPTTCTVGSYDEWIDASDHVPVFVEL